jgi:hypothetical protein
MKSHSLVACTKAELRESGVTLQKAQASGAVLRNLAEEAEQIATPELVNALL